MAFSSAKSRSRGEPVKRILPEIIERRFGFRRLRTDRIVNDQIAGDVYGAGLRSGTLRGKQTPNSNKVQRALKMLRDFYSYRHAGRYNCQHENIAYVVSRNRPREFAARAAEIWEWSKVLMDHC